MIAAPRKESDYVSRRQIEDWESRHGAIAQGDIVLFDFGWSARWALRPHDQRYVENWPGVGMEAAEYLISKAGGGPRRRYALP